MAQLKKKKRKKKKKKLNSQDVCINSLMHELYSRPVCVNKWTRRTGIASAVSFFARHLSAVSQRVNMAERLMALSANHTPLGQMNRPCSAVNSVKCLSKQKCMKYWLGNNLGAGRSPFGTFSLVLGSVHCAPRCTTALKRLLFDSVWSQRVSFKVRNLQEKHARALILWLELSPTMVQSGSKKGLETQPRHLGYLVCTLAIV